MSVKVDMGMERFVCAVGFKDHTWGTYSQNATTDTEAQGLLRSHFDTMKENGDGWNEDSATVEFIKLLRVEKIEEEYEDDDWLFSNKPTKIMKAKPVSNTDYNDDLDEDLDNIPFYDIDPEDEDLEDDVHNG
jgi:hypothetical protein|tara:strand:+ start:903 stop:1298 length:396 start_codon:yes stop_codon:yes gene_type:complete